MQRSPGPRAWALLIAAAALLAGCTGSGSDGAEDAEPLDPGTTPGGGAGGAGPGGSAGAGAGGGNGTADAGVVRFADGPPVTADLLFEGSFGLTDASFPFGLPSTITGSQSASSVQRHDLSAAVPQGVPTLLHAELTAADVGMGNLNMAFSGPPGSILRSSGTQQGGGAEVDEALVLYQGDGPLEVVVQYATVDDSEVAYTVTVHVMSQPELLPTGRPLAISVGPGATALAFEAIVGEEAEEDDGGSGGEDGDGDAAGAMVWDPADAYLGRMAASDGTALLLGEDAPGGEYVILLPPGSPDLRLRVGGAVPAGIRVLSTQALEGTAQDASSGSATWTFELPEAAIQVGYLVQSATATFDFEGAITNPDGEVVASVSAVFPRAGQLSDVSSVADEAIVPGTYEGTFSAQLAQGVQVTEYVVRYVREAAA